MENSNYIQVRNSQIRNYRDIPLYYLIGESNFSLYKPPGLSIAEMRLTEERHPQLFIQQKDRIESIKELQREFNQHIAESITKGNSVEVKSTLCNLVEETLSAPRFVDLLQFVISRVTPNVVYELHCLGVGQRRLRQSI